MSYTYSQLREDVNGRLHAKIGRVVSARNAINRGVRRAVKVPLKTLVRRYSSPLRLLGGLYDYTSPSDIQGAKVIDLRPISDARSNTYAWRNVHQEAFDRLRTQGEPVLSVSSNGTLRFLKASFNGSDNKVYISEMDSITDGGTWAIVGTASGLETDATTYLYGSGSIKFDLGAGTQDGISVPLTIQHNISEYTDDGSVFLSVSFPITTGLTGVTVRLGSDSSNYISVSATTDASGNTLTTGWNLLKMDLSGGTVTGSPDYDNIDYAAILIDKTSQTYTGIRVDRLMVGVGAQHYLEYYSRFGWRTTGGTWQENSTADTDILNAEEEEYDLVVEACVEEVSLDAREYADAGYAAKRFADQARAYRLANPDRSIVMSSDTWIRSSVSHQ
jgi:hypothetical protein